MKPPSLSHERLHLEFGRSVAGLDEVGRGSLAGPVVVGAVLLKPGPAVPRCPRGLRDSKFLSPSVREQLVPVIKRWGDGHALGVASAEEIDRWGIITALRLAAQRAVAALPELPDALILDGNHDYLSTGQLSLDEPSYPLAHVPPVTTVIKGDQRCASVAAASVLAKVWRDAHMVQCDAAFPDYGWKDNKGYSAAGHRSALLALGPSPMHRTSWNLTGEHVVDLRDQQLLSERQLAAVEDE